MSSRASFWADSLMSDRPSVDFFVEDGAHEGLIVPLTERIAADEGIVLKCRVRNARGGHARAIDSFKRYQTLRAKGVGGVQLPALLVVAIDGNCSTFSQARDKIRRATRDRYSHMLVPACPDPHIERWYMADPVSFANVVGTQPSVVQGKCERGYYKRLLNQTVIGAGHPSTLGGLEFGRELADAMDLFRAGKNDSSLGAFVTDLRERLRRVHVA